MSCTWHVVRKDILRLRLLLPFWFVGLIAETVAFGWARGLVLRLQWFVPLWRFVVLMLIVGLLVHEDGLLAPTAFWRTRPIGARALLRAKLLFIVLILVVPQVLAELVVLAAAGGTRGDLALAVPEVALEHLGTAMCMMAVAAVTPGIPTYFTALLVVILVPDFISTAVTAQSPAAVTGSMLASRSVAAYVVVPVLAFAVVEVQYRTRRTLLSVVMITAGVVVTALISASWNGNFILPVSAWLRRPIDTADIRYGFDLVSRGSTLMATPRIVSPTGAHSFDVQLLRSQLIYPNGERITSYPDLSWMHIGAAFDHLPPLRLKRDEPSPIQLLTAPLDVYNLRGDEPGKLEVVVRVLLWQYDAEATPLWELKGGGAGAFRPRVRSIASTNDVWTMRVEDTRKALVLSPETPWSPPDVRRWLPRYVFANTRVNEAVLPGVEYRGAGVTWGRITHYAVTLTVRDHVDERWLGEADLVRLVGRQVADYTVEVEIDGVALNNPAVPDAAVRWHAVQPRDAAQVRFIPKAQRDRMLP